MSHFSQEERKDGNVVAVRMRELSDADFARCDYVTFEYDAFRQEALGR